LAESLSAPKEPIINALRGASSPAPEGLAQFVSEKGYIPVAYLNPDLFASAVILPALSDLLSKNTKLLGRVTGFLRDFINRNRDVVAGAGIDAGRLLSSLALGPEGIKQMFALLPETVKIDLLNELVSRFPEIGDLVRRLSWFIDNLVVFAIPGPKVFVPSPNEWVVLRFGNVSVPVPIIGVYRGKRVTVLPVVTVDVAKKILGVSKLAEAFPGRSFAEALNLVTIQVPEIATAPAPSLEVSQPVQPPPLVVSAPGPSVKGEIPALGTSAVGVQRVGAQREMLTIF
ncbi:MAG: hypothetical protein C0179_04245, partial [Fervidicoccus sp.]